MLVLSSLHLFGQGVFCFKFSHKHQQHSDCVSVALAGC